MSGTCPDNLLLGQRLCDYHHGGGARDDVHAELAALSNGTKVLVKGTFQAGLVVRASAVTKKSADGYRGPIQLA